MKITTNKKNIKLSNFQKRFLDIFLPSVFIFLILASLFILKWNSFLLIILLLANIAIYISYRYGISIPGIDHFGRHYVKKNVQDFSQINSAYFHFRFIYYLILFCHDLDSGIDLLMAQSQGLGIVFDQKNKKKTERVKAEYLKEALYSHYVRKKKATAVVMASSVALTIVILAVALLIAPRLIRAATYGWTQSDWSGGASTTAMATHPTNETGWNKYYSKDAGVDASSTVALVLYSSSTTDTLTADFSAGSSTNAYATSGSVVMLKPANAACSGSYECGNNSCYCGNSSCAGLSGTCFTCGTSTVFDGYGPYDVGGLTTTTGGYYRTLLISSSTVTTTQQCWFKDNENNGTPIGSFFSDGVTNQPQTDNGSVEKYCNGYGADGNSAQLTAGTADCRTWGGLYQWAEAIQYAGGYTASSNGTLPSGPIQGICPTGWHIPSDGEFSAFSNILGGDTISGGALKLTGTSFWNSPNGSSTNSSGFSAIGSGQRSANGSFSNRNIKNFLLSTLPSGTANTTYRVLNSGDGTFSKNSDTRANGWSVRCLKDATTTVSGVIANNSTSYFTSAVKDFGVNANLGTFSWNASSTGPGAATLTMQVRTGASASTTDGSWTAFATVSSGDNVAVVAPTLSGKRYFQYRATMSSNDLNTIASLNDATINWSTYDRGHIPYTSTTPIMTSGNAPSPYIVSADSQLGGSYSGWRAFDNIASTEWINDGTNPTWLQIDTGAPTIINSYKITPYPLNGLPKTWILQGAMIGDGSDWVAIDSQTNVNNWSTGESRVYNFAPVSYRYYRLYVTDHWGTVFVSITEFSLGYTPTTLVSSVYDSGSASNVIPKIAWTETNTSTLNTVKFQIRVSNSSTTIASSTWCGYGDTGGTCDGAHYFDYSTNGKQITDTANPLMQGANGRYFQYRIILSSGGTSTPVVSQVHTTYVVNASPQFQSVVDASQRNSDGKVLINYSMLDLDTTSTGQCPYCVLSSFQYSTDNGSNWTDISSTYLVNVTSSVTGLLAGFGTTTISATSTDSYSIIWDAKSQIGGSGIFSPTTKIKITLNDLEGANNTAVTTTVAFTLDTKPPTLGKAGNSTSTLNGIVVIATTTPATILLNATDDSSGLVACVTTVNPGSNILNQADPNNHCQLFASTTAITLATPGQATVYVQFQDPYQNISNASAVTPLVPAGLVTRDISDIVDVPNVYQEFQAWAASNPANFSAYHIWDKIDSGSWQELTSIANPSQNYYYHQNLTGGADYHYKVYVQDIYGNASYFSSEVNDVTDGVGGTNVTPPNISNTTSTDITTQGATITWDTDVLANSTIFYSTQPPGHNGNTDDQTLGSITMLDNAPHVGRHQVTITGLLSDKDYWFQVQSVNALGISATDLNGGQGYYFHTLAGPQISGVTANQIANNSATIVWNTDSSADSHVYYSTSSANFAATAKSNGQSDSATSHSVVLTNLQRGTTYYYSAQSGIATDNNSGNYYYFTTPIDVTPPSIVTVTSSVVIDTKALISWTTGELADSNVFYGTSPGVYSANSADSAFDLSHNILLSGLATSTTYYYQVQSTDISGNLATSSEHSFITLEALSQESNVKLREQLAQLQGYASGTEAGVASVTCPVCQSCGGGGGSTIDRNKPVISNVTLSGIDGEDATFSWTTDKKANSIIDYGSSVDYDQNKIKYDSVTNHSVTVKYLNPATLYHYRVASIDENGNLGQSADATFSTTDLLGLPANPLTSSTNSSASSASAQENETIFTSALNKAATFISAMSTKVSLNTIQSAIVSQYNLIRQLSELVPPPLLGGEPRVIVTSNTATISWSTDKDSNSLVALALDAGFDKTKDDSAYQQVIGNADEQTQLHIVTLYDLQPETTYHYQVRSMALGGALAKSQDFTFLTKPQQLSISSYNVQNVDNSTAIFQWITTAETNSQVKYIPYRNNVLQIDQAQTIADKNYTTIHNIKINGFESGVTYQIELSSVDAKNKAIAQKIPDFRTGKDNLPPTIDQVQTESAISLGKQTNVQTVVSWQTNEPATGQVYYQKGAGSADEAKWEKTALDNTYTKKHIIVITKFESGVIYQFKILSADSSGNMSVSKVYTILTPKEKESVFQVIIRNFEDVFGWTGIGG